MIDALFTATTNLHVFPLNYGEASCRFCPRTWKEFQAYDALRGARVCDFFGGGQRRVLSDLTNWFPDRLLSQILDTHNRIRHEVSRGAYASHQSTQWNALAAQFRLLLERAQAARALGQTASAFQQEFQNEPTQSAAGEFDHGNAPVNSGWQDQTARSRQPARSPQRGTRRSSRNGGNTAAAPPPGDQSVPVRDAAQTVRDAAQAAQDIQTPASHKRIVKL